MWQDKISALKYSLLGGAMLVLAGCSVNPRNMAGATPAQTTQPDKNRQAQAHKSAKPHKTLLVRSGKASNNTLEKVTWCARKQQGKLYCWGGSSPTTGFDCSGLTQYAFQQGAGVSLPRTAAAQYSAATKVSETEARKGDLVFFKTRGKRVSHVGIYLGDNRFIHAPRTGKSITTSKLSGYWKRRLVGFGRIQGACRPMYS
ncbi:MAG: C40 family peptidase [Thiothrix sp.]|uniref:C40 family peptidase n=1 Tax=Thiothrix sp. TaxID=1032 RepID=UPI00262CA6CB|nr:C40 family peptidase [Thiothrix sp.]MDD5391435.1 C40 family peptidase [Thiothrix sp.]